MGDGLFGLIMVIVIIVAMIFCIWLLSDQQTSRLSLICEWAGYDGYTILEGKEFTILCVGEDGDAMSLEKILTGGE